MQANRTHLEKGNSTVQTKRQHRQLWMPHSPSAQRASLTWVLIFFTDKILVSVIVSLTVSTIAFVSKILLYF